MRLLFGAGTSSTIEVDINQCVHYCGFRYGCGEYHPYETYIVRLHHKEPLEKIRDEFLQFLKFYRPRDFGQLLGVDLSRQYPLWLYPWRSRLKYWYAKYRHTSAMSVWYASPDKIPDIITHFSSTGVPRRMIEKEYGWLHGAYESISVEGYKPEKYGYPHAQLLHGYDGEIACLMLDGNHRVSALSALGYESLVVKYHKSKSIHIQHIDDWTGVKTGFYTKNDALKIFNAYFVGNADYFKSSNPAPIV